MLSKTKRSAIIAAALVCFQMSFADELDDAISESFMEGKASQFSIYREFAEQGHPRAQYFLGQMYEDGYEEEGVPQDYFEALTYYNKAANQGHRGAQYALGRIYFKGEGGVRPDYAKAVEWFLMAAKQGHVKAQHGLGIAYGNGQGVPQNYVEAHAWWNLAASQGNEFARKNRDRVTQRMTPAQIAEAQRLAREWAAKY